MSKDDVQDPNFWWSELNHGGMLLSPAILKEFLPDGPPQIDIDSYKELRDAYTAFESWSERKEEEASDNVGLYRWLDAVFDQFLDYPSMLWQKENVVSDRFKFQTSAGERLRPNRVLLDKGMQNYHRYLIKIDTREGRLGMGKGRVEYSKFLTLLRGTGVRFGIFTNGYQFRLIYVGMDYDCWVEWDATRWFEEESGIAQLAGFVALCGENATYRTDEDEFPLLTAVLNSRTRQGELSQVLGEQVRLAVEKLLSSFDKAVRTHPALLESLITNPITGSKLKDSERLDALYNAAIRVIMRLVVVLFAEARELLPKSMEKYYSSYGIEGLYASLEEAARYGGNTNLSESNSAWPRLLGLFRIIHEGCSNEDIPVPRYGGELFKKGDQHSPDTILRALAIFEDERWMLDDLVVLEILRLLKIGKVRARKGRASTWVSGPVDFSDLRTEYIGMMYEGVLDYQLKQVTEEQGAVVFLNLGQQPALPLSLLENLSDKDLKDLIDKLKEKIDALPSEGTDGEEEIENILDEEELPEDQIEELESLDQEPAPESPYRIGEEEVKQRVFFWAEKAVKIGGLSKKPQGKKANLYAYEQEVVKKAGGLLLQVYGPGEMYLVRGGGTRKGTGTFYTRPQLAVPTVHRTLEPLVYDKNEETGELIPKDPGTILSLKIVDPAMGSASFLVGGLRYLTDALYESLLYHKKIRERSSGGCVITLPFGLESEGGIQEELLPVNPEDERFEQLLKARLKRHVVERCIYGVDINPLAVELARLSLWIETMDRELPFEFLAHKLKVGNSLVGCWLDRFEDYPVLAWAREGGDGSKGVLTKKIKSIFNGQVKPQMKNWIERMGPQKKLTAWTEEESAINIQEQNMDFYSRLHELKKDEREQFFRENIQNNENLKLLKNAVDRWCAIWFWPVHDENAQLLTPDRFYQPNDEDVDIVGNITRGIGFFHWELEFPDVFTSERSGFDAVLGNPPWEIMKPNSKEFFTWHDPIYRTYGKQEAIDQQKELFKKDPTIETEWILYNAFYKSMSNWVKNAQDPFSVNIARGKADDKLKMDWKNIRNKRIIYASKSTPFRYQGSADLNTYKMFLETSHHLLREGGRLGMIVPSGLYTDKGTIYLRTLFLDNCRWEWLFGFENKKNIFNIHRNYKFCSLIVEKGGTTQAIQTAFMRYDLIDWETPEQFCVKYDKARADPFSPVSRSILEVGTQRDLEILEKIYKNSILFADEGKEAWRIEYVREFDLTNDSKHFPPIDKWFEKGYKPNDYGRWIGPEGDVALPLYEGRMIGQFDFSEKGWVSGKGRGAIWQEIQFDSKRLEPQFLLNEAVYRQWPKYFPVPKLAFIDVTTSIHFRTMISTMVAGFPAGNATPVLVLKNRSLTDTLTLSALLNSFTYDFVAKRKCTSLHLSYFVVSETPLVKATDIPSLVKQAIVNHTASLTLIHKLFAPDWLRLKRGNPDLASRQWKSWWAVTERERLRLRCILDAIVAELYDIDYDDFAWILRDDPGDPKGFWRVDKDKPKELRHTTLALQAFERLKEVGLEAFCGEDWQFPEDIQEKLGPRFLPWQLEGTPEETWAECEQHAKNILGEEEYKKFIKGLSNQKTSDENDISVTSDNKSEQEKRKQESILSWGDKK
ncbi:MAG: hypothetical protein KKA79_01075 [Nanoarchaeota archaeon]|nr:hypothetical protein [Nanoarchaeota archaeon]MCG2718005.1 hypothetical protein [Nanoarchaeota archaeon]